MPSHAITLAVPVGPSLIEIGFDRDADSDVRLLLRLAGVRSTATRVGFWLEYGTDDGDSQMFWIDPGHMPAATFRCNATGPRSDGRENDMRVRLANEHHLYFTPGGWQADTHEFPTED